MIWALRLPERLSIIPALPGFMDMVRRAVLVGLVRFMIATSLLPHVKYSTVVVTPGERARKGDYLLRSCRDVTMMTDTLAVPY